MVPADAPIETASATRAAIQQAFVALLFQRRYAAVRVVDIIASAGIGRSTFYTHFRSKDDVLLAAIEPVLASLADSATGSIRREDLVGLLDHVWGQRATGRLIFTRELTPRLQRKLAAMIEERMGRSSDAPAAIVATGVAAAQLAMLQLWVSGGASSSAEALASVILTASPLQR